MRNLLSMVAPHPGPGPSAFYSLIILVSFVPSFLSNQILWVDIQSIQNNLVPSSNSQNASNSMSIPDDITDSATTSDHNLNPLWEVIHILVLLNKHPKVMDIEQNVYNYYVYLQDYLKVLQELRKLLNNFHPINTTVLYVQVYAATDSDTGINNDADTCNFDNKWNAHVCYGYLESVGIQESKCGTPWISFMPLCICTLLSTIIPRFNFMPSWSSTLLSTIINSDIELPRSI